MNPSHTSEPFGHFSLPPQREAIRLAAVRARDNKFGHWAISLRRKRAIKDLSEPFDINVAPDVKARLYPSTNRCEKRALCGVQIWDAVERDALQRAVTAHDTAEPFVFLDVGANVGLYSLFVSAYARQAGRATRIIAVEPSADIGARLRFNAQASGAHIEHVNLAVSDHMGHAKLSTGGTNRGEGRLSDHGQAVEVVTLGALCERLTVTRIDAMKLDIEGHDTRALTHFLTHSPEPVHPNIFIIERGSDKALGNEQSHHSALVELAKSKDYLLRDVTPLNAIFEKSR
jgi:FkbM family methyltransferase